MQQMSSNNQVQASSSDMLIGVNETASYKVVRNAEAQYSIWPAQQKNAYGWFDEGMSGTKDACLAHIDAVWLDMRPLSLQKAMQKAGVATEL